MDIFWIYTCWSGDDSDDDVSNNLDTVVEERGHLPDAENLRSNLLDVNSNMRSQVNDKLTNIIVPLLKFSAPTKYHYWFDLLLDPRYAIELKDIKTIHQSSNLDTKALVQKMMPKFYEYIMAAELDVHPNTPQILVSNN